MSIDEPFAKFFSMRDLLQERVVIPGRWRLPPPDRLRAAPLPLRLPLKGEVILER